MKIEEATLADLDALVAAWVTLAQEQRDHGSHVRADPNREAMRESLSQSIVVDDLLVARADGEIVGFVTLEIERGRLEQDVTRGIVPYLFVAPDRRGEGIGAELLEGAESRLEDQGADVVSLAVMADNEAAQRFYRRHGYDRHRVTMEKPTSNESDTHSKDDR
ncbi:MAG: ribosomal protein S18 acetylase RimI-like enzyme [Halobacteriales archaeon]|jgi:ribosomal protein S18 acetylase RimI-like enzyme